MNDYNGDEFLIFDDNIGSNMDDDYDEAMMVMRLSERHFLDGTMRKRETKSEQRKAKSEQRKAKRDANDSEYVLVR